MRDNQFRSFISDERIIKELIDPHTKLVLVLGASDTGKTSLIEGMADFLSATSEVGIVDLDIGQSHIGPPTTVAWGKVGKGFSGWKNITPEDFYFTGAVSPVGNLVSMLTGSILVTSRALSACEKVIVDTTGLIQEPAGRVLKQHKIDLLRPDVVISLERERELSAILDPFTWHKSPILHRLPVPQKVVIKTPSERSLFRSSMFTHYFQNDRLVKVSLKKIGFRFTGDFYGFTLETAKFMNELQDNSTGLIGRIVSLRDERNTDRALGIIQEFDEKEKKFLIRTPLGREFEISTVVIGSLKVEV
ncbi:MAG: hypothetical protein AMS17_02800 [Spirochaetes bacterium DG_61]|jgi:polynucleotide 5'-hydroxyl-kinase GRC3/NOL9|nr:MAG: hypothetical protein AMS17_02800 [Spirochaetes bacterium DG_61]